MFHEVIISSFECPHCGERNSEIQPGAPLQDKGVRFTLTVKDTRVRGLFEGGGWSVSLLDKRSLEVFHKGSHNSLNEDKLLSNCLPIYRLWLSSDKTV